MKRIKDKFAFLTRKNIPCMITIGNLLCGFLAIIYAIQKDFYLSCMLIIAAFVLDMLDGMIARRFKWTSELGLQLDSLADTVSFVLAPAFLIYFKFFNSLLGIIVSCFIITFGILRLAKFNITKSKGYFEGLPTPEFTAIAIALVFVGITLKQEILAVLIILASYLMVSKIKFPELKSKEFIKYKYKAIIIFIILILAIVFQFDLMYIAIILHGLIWILGLIPTLFNKSIKRKSCIVLFCLGFLILTGLLINDYKALIALPFIYMPLASPLVQSSLKVKK